MATLRWRKVLKHLPRQLSARRAFPLGRHVLQHDSLGSSGRRVSSEAPSGAGSYFPSVIMA